MRYYATISAGLVFVGVMTTAFVYFGPPQCRAPGPRIAHVLVSGC